MRGLQKSHVLEAAQVSFFRGCRSPISEGCASLMCVAGGCTSPVTRNPKIIWLYGINPQMGCTHMFFDWFFQLSSIGFSLGFSSALSSLSWGKTNSIRLVFSQNLSSIGFEPFFNPRMPWVYIYIYIYVCIYPPRMGPKTYIHSPNAPSGSAR